jgi:hypothetical protein
VLHGFRLLGRRCWEVLQVACFSLVGGGDCLSPGPSSWASILQLTLGSSNICCCKRTSRDQAGECILTFFEISPRAAQAPTSDVSLKTALAIIFPVLWACMQSWGRAPCEALYVFFPIPLRAWPVWLQGAGPFVYASGQVFLLLMACC